MISWFLHMYPKNKILTHPYAPTRTEIFDCYEETNNLVTHRLEQKSKELDRCQQLVRNLISRNGPEMHEYTHITLNYNFYTSELLSQSKKKMFMY